MSVPQAAFNFNTITPLVDFFSNSRNDICAGTSAAQCVLTPVESGIYQIDSCLEIMYYSPDQILDGL